MDQLRESIDKHILRDEENVEEDEEGEFYCESCEYTDDEPCSHDHHNLCVSCCENQEPMDWNDLD